MLDARPRARDWLVVFAVAIALRWLGAWSIPLARSAPLRACAPDELGHFDAAAALAAGSAATWPDAQSIYTVYPPSQYAAQALALAALPSQHATWLQRSAAAEPAYVGYGAARLGSVALGVATVLLLMSAAQRATESRGVACAVGLAMAGYPQLVFISSYVNGDAMTLAAAAFLVWALAGWVRRGEASGGLAWVGLAAGAVLLGKPYGYAALVPAAVWVARAAVVGRAAPRAAFGAALTAALVAAPPLAWNAARNGGDPLGLVKYQEFISRAGVGHPGAARLVDVAVFLRATAISSFAKLGNMSIALPTPLYLPWAGLVLCGAATLARLATRGAGAARRAAIALAATAGLSAALLVYNAWRVDFQPQGRYVLVPTLLIAALPLAVPPERLGERGRRWWRVAWVGFLLLAGIWTAGTLYFDPCGD